MAIHEECGVFGILSRKRERLGKLVYYGLYALQHRGQESCGIVVNDDGVFSSYHGPQMRIAYRKSLRPVLCRTAIPQL